jgi:pyridoxine 5-phosphate synthase
MGYSSKPSLFNRDDSRVSTQRNPNVYFVDPQLDMIEGEKKTGTDRIELYTEAHQYGLGNQAIEPYIAAAVLANDLGLGVNAGHDLSLDNIQFLNKTFPVYLKFLSDTPLITESLYLGLENVVNMYLQN